MQYRGMTLSYCLFQREKNCNVGKAIKIHDEVVLFLFSLVQYQSFTNILE